MREARLGDFLAPRSRGIVPNVTPETTFELYSVPSFERRQPEVVKGAAIGSNKQIVAPGTVLLCKINPRINRAWVVGAFSSHQKIASTEWITFPPSDQLQPKYLAYFLSKNSVRGHLAANASGVGGSLMRVKASTVKDVTFPLPPLAAQVEIVAEIDKQFSRLDEAVATLQRVKANVKRYKAAVLKAAIERQLVESPTTEPWNVMALARASEVQLGQQRAPVHAAATEQVPYVRAANVTWEGLDLTDVKTMGFPNPDRYRLRVGDVLLAEASGSASEVGKPSMWNGEIPGACYQKTLIRIRPKPDMLLPRFVYYVFLHTSLSGQFARLAPGVGILHLTAERMLEWPIAIPPLGEQQEIVAEVDHRLSIVREVEAEVDANLKRAQALRQSILSAAFAMRGPRETMNAL